jgi:hypothetical protein
LRTQVHVVPNAGEVSKQVLLWLIMPTGENHVCDAGHT